MKSKKIIIDILDLSLPVIAEMTLYTLMWIIDMLLIGRFGGNFAVSVVGLSDEILYTFNDIFIITGICVGINSLVSRNIGGNKQKIADEYSSTGFICGAFISIIICLLLFFFCNNLLSFAGAKVSILNAGSLYLKLSLPGIFFSMLISTICSVLRGHGNTKTPCFIAFIVTILKLSLDFILVFYTPLGIYGAALATVLSQLIGLVILLKSFKFSARINFVKLKELVLLSIPSSLEEGAFSMGRLLSTFMIMRLGTVAFAANQIATSIESISFMPGIGFGVATTTMVGFCVGEKNYKKAKKYAYITTILTTFMMLVCSVFFILIPGTLVSVFINQKEVQVIALATHCLIIGAFEQAPMAVYMVLGAALKGYGDTKSPFIVSLISSWGIRLPLMFYFIYLNKGSVTYVWWITTVQWTFNAILLYIMFRRTLKNN